MPEQACIQRKPSGAEEHHRDDHDAGQDQGQLGVEQIESRRRPQGKADSEGAHACDYSGNWREQAHQQCCARPEPYDRAEPRSRQACGFSGEIKSALNHGHQADRRAKEQETYSRPPTRERRE